MSNKTIHDHCDAATALMAAPSPDFSPTCKATRPRVVIRRPGQKPHKKCWSQRAGAAAVEMAIVLPLLLILVFGIIEFGRAMMVQQILVNTAREAARRAVVPGATDEQVYGILDSYLENAGIDNYEAHIELDGVRHPFNADGSSGNQFAYLIDNAQHRTKIGIDLSVLHSDVAWGPMYLIAGDRRISAVVLMRKE
ncbi:pilus assembly protein [Rubripirellula sp.]|nr:TadE family protein [Rubripirellula sp.]MDB4749618.1 pilus assembly protein [Rubripirellula sp.]